MVNRLWTVKKWNQVIYAVYEEANDPLLLIASNVKQLGLRSYSNRCNAVVNQLPYLIGMIADKPGKNLCH